MTCLATSLHPSLCPLNNSLSHFVIVFFIVGLLFAAEEGSSFEIENSLDTVSVLPGDSVLVLKHSLVIAGTELIRSELGRVPDYHVESVPGRIVLSQAVEIAQEFVVSYEHFSSPFRTRIEAPLLSMPRLEDHAAMEVPPDELQESFPLENELPLVADGTIFRGVSISPYSGVALTGGLQIGLQGQLSDDMTVSGTLSDQNTPIQPEGNTQTLEEIDKVYLEIKHPSATVVVGDIDMALNQGQFMNVTRRLEGLNMQMTGNRTDAAFYLAGTKGKFRSMAFTGEDGNQGPYPLLSDHGSRSIVVMASSERIWLDGVRMERGENTDYTIDYSRGEITFTPNRLIDSNSRVHIEFEYSDLVYPRQIASTSLRRVFADGKSSTSVVWIKESDNLEMPLAFSLSREDKEQLKKLGDSKAIITTAFRDKKGRYRTEPGGDTPGDSIFVWVLQEERDDAGDYFRVIFHNMGSEGEYARRVTHDGEIYFEYVGESLRPAYSDLYVPFKSIRSPESHQVFSVFTDLYLGDSTRAAINLAGSLRDRNLFSSYNDGDNRGFAGTIQLSHARDLPRDLGHISMTAYTGRQGERFSPLQRDRQVEFHREWNISRKTDFLSEPQTVSEQLTQLEISHRLGKRSSSSVSLGRYSDSFQHSTRWRTATSLSLNWMPEFTVDVTGVSTDHDRPQVENRTAPSLLSRSSWQRERFSAQFLPGSLHPFVHYESEDFSSQFKYREAGGGFVSQTERVKIEAGVTQRMDYAPAGESSPWSEESESWLGELAMRGKWRQGYRFSLLIKQRVKAYSDGRGNLNYGLARGSLAYHPHRGNLRTSTDFKLERTMFQERIVLYDSVGIGLGQYRYDPEYDQYFPDPTGAFVARHIPSGKRTPASHLITDFKLFYSFKNSPNSVLKYTTWRLYANIDHNGSDLKLDTVVRPAFATKSVNLSRTRVQHDLNYTPRGSRRRVKISSLYRLEVMGQSTQYPSEHESAKQKISLEEPISGSVTLVANGKIQRSSVETTIVSRQRRTGGWFLDSGIRWRPVQSVEWGSDIRYGNDEGTNAYEGFAVTLTGGGAHVLVLPRKGGRVNLEVDYYRVNSKTPVWIALPPEAAEGLQLGENFSARLTSYLVLGRNISATLSSAYILDSIHDGILNVSGEIRATF